MTNENGKALRRGMMALRLEVDPMIVESLMVLARKAIDEAHAAGFRGGVTAAHDVLIRCRDGAESGNDYEVLDGAMADVRAILDRTLAQPAATGEDVTGFLRTP